MTELEFGARLKLLRQEKRLTQQELADRLGVSNKSVSRWESGGYPDVATLAPLAKALGVSVDELLGCQPPLRAFGRSDWQNLMSYAFALGGGVVFYLFDLFMPALLCYLLYLAMMAYGVYLQRHYTYHSRWFYAANALMDLCINLKLTALVGGSALLMGAQNITLMTNYMMQADNRERLTYLGRLLLYLLPWLLLALALTAITQLVIYRTAGEKPALPKLTMPKVKLSRREVKPVKLLPVLSPVLLAGFWFLYSMEDPLKLWLYKQQMGLYLVLWLVLAVVSLLYLWMVRQRGTMICAAVMQLCTLGYPALAGTTRAFSTVSGRFIEYSIHLNTEKYIPFGQGNGAILVMAAVLCLLYLLGCMVKVEKKL